MEGIRCAMHIHLLTPDGVRTLTLTARIGEIGALVGALRLEAEVVQAHLPHRD